MFILFRLIHSVFYFVIYRIVWKNLFKRFIRLLLGTHEIQRVCATNNYMSLSIYLLIK